MKSFLAIPVFCLTGFAFAVEPDSANELSSGASSVTPDFTIESIKRGRQYYAVHCVRCHGTDGKGDTEMREFLKTQPADLSDDQWFYGGSDEIVFSVIKAGRTERDMPSFAETLDDPDIRHVINYMRYLGGKRP